MLTSRALIVFSLLLCASTVKADQYVFSCDGPDLAYQLFRNEKKLSLSLFQGLMKVQLSVPLGQVSASGSVQITPTSIENIPSCPFGGIKDSSAACAIWLMHLGQGQYFLAALNQLIELSTAHSDYLIRVVLLRQKEN